MNWQKYEISTDLTSWGVLCLHEMYLCFLVFEILMPQIVWHLCPKHLVTGLNSHLTYVWSWGSRGWWWSRRLTWWVWCRWRMTTNQPTSPQSRFKIFCTVWCCPGKTTAGGDKHQECAFHRSYLPLMYWSSDFAKVHNNVFCYNCCWLSVGVCFDICGHRTCVSGVKLFMFNSLFHICSMSETNKYVDSTL